MEEKSLDGSFWLHGTRYYTFVKTKELLKRNSRRTFNNTEGLLSTSSIPSS